jgi:hypothetical protein
MRAVGEALAIRAVEDNSFDIRSPARGASSAATAVAEKINIAASPFNTSLATRIGDGNLENRQLYFYPLPPRATSKNITDSAKNPCCLNHLTTTATRISSPYST